MPDIRYACSICGRTFDDEEHAERCENKGEPELPTPGRIYKYWDTNQSSRIIAIESAVAEGHDRKITYMYEDNEPGDPDDSRMWGLNDRFEFRDVWMIARRLAEKGIMPQIAVSVDDLNHSAGVEFMPFGKMIERLVEMRSTKPSRLVSRCCGAATKSNSVGDTICVVCNCVCITSLVNLLG